MTEPLFGYSPYYDVNDSDNRSNANGEMKEADEDEDVAAVRDGIVLGGDIKLTGVLQYIILAVLIFLVIYILVSVFYSFKIDGENYNQRQTHKYFDNLHGDTYDDDAKRAIEYGEAIKEPRAIDHYRIGTTYLINANNPVRAHGHFNQALQQIINGQVGMRDVPFIIERIEDYRDRFLEVPDVHDLPLQQALLAHYEAKTRMLQTVEQKKPVIADNDPEFTQKMLISRQNWLSDSQNVHDSAINNELREQLLSVRESNGRIPDIKYKDYDDATNWLLLRYKDDSPNKAKIQQVLGFLQHNYSVDPLGIREKDILTAVWQRAHDPANKGRCNEIKEALADSVLDCVEGKNVVCLDGRTTKIWQALATLDDNPKIGILKSKQALRNEIYERSAKIVDDHVGAHGSASAQLRSDYNKGEDTEQVKELVEVIKEKIEDLKDEYSDRLPREQLDLTINECKAIV